MLTNTERRKEQRILAALGGLLAWSAVILQLFLMVQNRTTSVGEALVRFFSYFTILTNTLVAICLTAVVAEKRGGKDFFSLPTTMSATTVYIIIVGLVYNLVLRSVWDPQGLQKLVDELLHSVVPLYFFFYWLLFVRKESLKMKNIYAWLTYPLVYLVYILARGAASGFYPYPFINVTELGYPAVIKNSVVLLGVFLLFSLLLVGIAKLVRRKLST